MNLEEEIRNGYKISSKMKRVWLLQMEATKAIIEICQRHNLKIWAESGTLLGCIREKGFIPWDDDIDLAMLRDDYDKLLEYAPKELPYPYFYQTAYTESVPYNRAHSQVRIAGTAAMLNGEAYSSIDQSIFVDIFVLDVVPDEPERLSEKIHNVFYLKSIVDNLYIPNRFSFIMSPKQYYWFFKRVLLKLRYDFITVYKQLEDEMRRDNIHENSKIVKFALICNESYIRNKGLNKEWYDETIWMSFEDIQIPVPIGYDKILSTIYGRDYMVPSERPSAHGGYLVLDTVNSYKNYLNEIRKKTDKERIKRIISKLKSLITHP